MVSRFKPDYPGEFPTLGFTVLEWMTEYLAAPDREEFEPLRLTREQSEFVLNWYRLDPVTGRRVYRRGVLARPKGWGKSPFGSALCLAEGLAPVVFDGWDANGRPVGMPWARKRTPIVNLLGVSESQTANAWVPMLEMARGGSLVDEYPGFEPLETRINLPSGYIEPRTSAGTSAEGAKPVFSLLDQTEAWVSGNGGKRLAEVVRRNAGKIGGTTIEFPNAFKTGEGSVAEDSFNYWVQIQAGNTKDNGLLFDSRDWGETVDLDSEDSVLEGLAKAYGDSADLPGGCVIHEPPCTPDNGWPAGWVDLHRIQQEIWDPATTVADAHQYYGNRAHADANAFIEQHQWAAAEAPDTVEPVTETDPVVLGFDGSRHRSKGVTDATALVAMRVSDGFSWPVGIWEQPDTKAGRDWEPPEYEIEQTLDSFMESHHVVGFYADPTLWESNVAGWESKYGSRLLVGSKFHPIVWRTSQVSRTVESVAMLRDAILDGKVIHNGDFGLTRHVLNARMRKGRSGALMYKEFPDSARKIDAAYSLMLANRARVDALAHGGLEKKAAKKRFVPKKLR